MDFLLPDATPQEQLAALGVIVSGVVALGTVVVSLLIPRVTSRWEHRRWLRDRRTEVYDELMQIMEDANLVYEDDDETGPSNEEIASRLKALKARMRLYGSTKSIRLLDDLHRSFHRSRLTPIVDAEADLHIKKTWLASMKLLFQIQRETRRPMPRVMRRPIYARELKKQMRKLDGFIKTLELEPERNDAE